MAIRYHHDATGYDAHVGLEFSPLGSDAEALARAVDIPVIASGGVSSMQDLEALKATGVISGAISGRALYDGAIDLRAALKALS